MNHESRPELADVAAAGSPVCRKTSNGTVRSLLSKGRLARLDADELSR